MPRSPLHHRLRRTLVALAATALAVGAALAFRTGPASDPSFDGRRTSEWFHRLLRFNAPPRSEEDELRTLEARRALLRLGTNAVPWLVDQVLCPGSDGPLRRSLRNLGRIIQSPGLHPGQFPTPSHKSAEAIRILESIQPSFDLVAPLLRSEGTGRAVNPTEAVRLLAVCPDAGSRILPFAEAVPEDPQAEARAVHALAFMAPVPTNVLTYLLKTLPRASVGSLPHAQALAALGPAAKEARAWLEAGLVPMTNNPQPRIWAALALLEVDPGHPGATAVLRSIPEKPVFDSRNEFLKIDAAFLCLAITHWRQPIRSPVTREVIERLARQEIEGWTRSGMSLQASRALETIDPSKAASLYLQHLSYGTPPEIRLAAAGAVLRNSPDPSPALPMLQNALNRYDYPAVLAARQLGEASPRFAPALEMLREAATNAFIPGARQEAQASLLRVEIRALELAARGPADSPGSVP